MGHPENPRRAPNDRSRPQILLFNSQQGVKAMKKTLAAGGTNVELHNMRSRSAPWSVYFVFADAIAR